MYNEKANSYKEYNMAARLLRQRLETLALCEFSQVEVRYFENGSERYKTPELTFDVDANSAIIVMSDSAGRVEYSDTEIEKQIASLEELAHRERFLGI